MPRTLSLAIALVLCACGGSPVATSRAPALAAQPAASQPAAAGARPGATAPAGTDRTLKRSAIHGAVSQGLGVFLQRIELDDQPVRVDGRFHGFRIAALRDANFWSGVDLKPGDVVTSVNGFPIERPEQAQTVFDSLEVASELRVTYERDGKPREIVYPIIDDR
jgi:type II secretion system protein C